MSSRTFRACGIHCLIQLVFVTAAGAASGTAAIRQQAPTPAAVTPMLLLLLL
jgi:hypothetical protein